MRQMDNHLKPIETVYAGYRFRSRLEARWAVFFDTLGLAYEYEKEGFDLGPAGWYLPDFWLPDLEYWVEIKPRHLATNGWQVFIGEDQPIAYKCGMLAQMSQQCVFLLTGVPGDSMDPPGDMAPYLWFYPVPDANEYGIDHAQWFTQCRQCGAIHIAFEGNAEWCGHEAVRRKHRPPYDGSIIKKAIVAARQARFEHKH